MKRFFFLCLFSVVYGSEYSLVFVHIGDQVPAYAITSIRQARFMNESCDVYFLINEGAEQSLDTETKKILEENRISLVKIDSIPESQEHESFKKENRLADSLNGFWKHATERFFIIFDFLEHTNIEKVVHLENDTMLYVDLNEIVPQFEYLEIELAAPFQSISCCVPCFVFIKNSDALHPLIDHIIVETKEKHIDDMMTLSSYFRAKGDYYMFPLAVLMADYPKFYDKRTSSFGPDNETSLEFLTKNGWAFPEYIFDAAALGVYVNGNDKRYNPGTGPGEIHHRTLCDPSHFFFYWGKDKNNRDCPYLTFNNRSYRIVNLHFHSKELEGYTSYKNSRLEFQNRRRK